MSNLILTFDGITEGDIEKAGIVAYDMARLSHSGVPVAASFCVSSEALREVLIGLGIPEREKALAGENPASPGFAAAAELVMEDVRNAAIPPELEAPLAEALGSLEYRLVEVALSPVVAGYDAAAIGGLKWRSRYLPADAVADAVPECWAAAWTPRALGFRMKLGLYSDSAVAAVLVSEARPAPFEGRIVPTGEDGEAWVIEFDQRVRGPRDIPVERRADGKPPSPLTSAQAEALTILADAAAEILGEPRTLNWTFEGSRFTIIGIPYG